MYQAESFRQADQAEVAERRMRDHFEHPVPQRKGPATEPHGRWQFPQRLLPGAAGGPANRSRAAVAVVRRPVVFPGRKRQDRSVGDETLVAQEILYDFARREAPTAKAARPQPVLFELGVDGLQLRTGQVLRK